jgi:hypothetical protein
MCAVLYGAYESLALYHTARIQRFQGNRIRQVLCHGLPYILLRIGLFLLHFCWSVTFESLVHEISAELSFPVIPRSSHIYPA